jgi:hypothetical protein
MAISAEIRANICDAIAAGKSLRQACEDEGVKHSTFLLWVKQDKDLADQYAQAREIGTDVEFDALGDMALEEPERGPTGTVDAGWVAWKRLQVDAKKWALSKKAPKKYGDKIEHEHTGGIAVTLSSTDAEL